MNQSREDRNEQPTASLELLVQAGAVPGLPSASTSALGSQSVAKSARELMDTAAVSPLGGAEVSQLVEFRTFMQACFPIHYKQESFLKPLFRKMPAFRLPLQNWDD